MSDLLKASFFQLFEQMKHMACTPFCPGRESNMHLSQTSIRTLVDEIGVMRSKISSQTDTIAALKRINEQLEAKLTLVKRQTTKRRKACRKRK